MGAKPIEWKDTRFTFSVKYNYSLFVRNRCVFFHCLAKNVRKMINYAKHFANPANICVIYVYGAVNAKSVTPQLAEKNGHMLLMSASGISKEDINTIDDYVKWLKVLKAQGFLKITKQGTPQSKYNAHLVGIEYGEEPSEKWFETYNVPEWLEGYEIYTEGMDLIDKYQKALVNVSSAQQEPLKVLSNFPAPETLSGETEIHDSELLKIIKSLYPYGVESDTTDETAVKLLKIKKLTEAALREETTPDVERLNIHFANSDAQLCFWETVTEGAEKCLAFLENYCSEKISEKGCFSLSELWFEFMKPPYGAYSSNWYCYIFALAIRKYNTSKYFYGHRYYAINIQNNLQNLDFKIPYGFIFIQNADQKKFRDLFARLFDIEDPAEDTSLVILQAAMDWVSKNIKWVPLDCIDHRFHEIFVEYSNSSWYEFGYEKYLPWLKENFDDLYVRIRTLDEKFHEVLAAIYGPKLADFYCENHTVRNGAVGWLHSKEMLEESVKKYMESLLCCECGRQIARADTPKNAFVYQGSSNHTDGNYEVFDFSLKDVIGLNKKLLGRSRTDYLCIPCLAEYSEYSEDALYNLAHDFKEQGCTLFA